MKARLALVALCAAALAVTPAGAASKTGTVVKVVDGDTVRVKVNGRTVTVNLSGGCPGATSKLRSLLPRGSRVRIRGRRVYRGSRLINRSVRAECRRQDDQILDETQPDPNPTPQPTPSPQPGQVDTPQNRAALDTFLRGSRFTLHDQGDSGSLPGGEGPVSFTRDFIHSFCADGRYIVRKIFVSAALGNEDTTATGTWKVNDITQNDAIALAGNLAITAALPGQAPESFFMLVARKADGTAAFMVGDEQELASKAPTTAC